MEIFCLIFTKQTKPKPHDNIHYSLRSSTPI